MPNRIPGCVCELDPKTSEPVVLGYAMCPIHKPDSPDPKLFAKDYIKMFEPNANWEDWDDKGERIKHENICAIKMVNEILLILTSENMKPFTSAWVSFYESVKKEIEIL